MFSCFFFLFFVMCAQLLPQFVKLVSFSVVHHSIDSVFVCDRSSDFHFVWIGVVSQDDGDLIAALRRKTDDDVFSGNLRSLGRGSSGR